MALRELDFPSFNGRDTVKAWVYTPIRKPRAIVQVVHGFMEHSRRYLHMILELNEAGFVVAADDHVGHGKTAADSDTWGDFGGKGYMTTTEDEKSLHDLVCASYPDLPFVMFGHSWGSMIARNYAAHYGADLKGLVICGTPGNLETVPPLSEVLKARIAGGKGKESELELLGALFAGMTDRYDNPRTPNDWISADPDVVADHAADPFNNFKRLPDNLSLYEFVELCEAITGVQWAEKVPKELPIYNIAGDQDPVGSYGEGVYAVSNWLANTGHRRVNTVLYPGHRHEIHNDRDIRVKVVFGVISFIDELLYNSR
jgi:alpha-beta hydrolase superfamily lysophospholipase